MKNLAVFDFDHTIIQENSDKVVKNILSMEKYSSEFIQQAKESGKGWVHLMQEVFKVLHENDITELQITNLIKNLPEVHGLTSLITHLKDQLNFDIIIISDSNTYFINLWLQANNIASKILKVFSNPAEFNENGLLVIKKYFENDHNCKLDRSNLCKGTILKDFLKEQLNHDGTTYDKVFYIGDGSNDLCPILELNSNSVACCRENFACIKLVRRIKKGLSININGIDDNCSDPRYKIVEAELCAWETGDDILDYLNGVKERQNLNVVES